MNPCPCGFLGSSRCRCTPARVERYRERLSGPLLDRIDIRVEVPLPRDCVLRGARGEASAEVASRVAAARSRQVQARGCLNARLTASDLAARCAVTPAALRLLEQAVARLGLSIRAAHRILRLARTAADLAGSECVDVAHASEAVALRRTPIGTEQPNT